MPLKMLVKFKVLLTTLDARPVQPNGDPIIGARWLYPEAPVIADQSMPYNWSKENRSKDLGATPWKRAYSPFA